MADDYLRSAVKRQFEILAEALNIASREDTEIRIWFDQLPQIVGLRNQLAHGYDAVDDVVVWDAVVVNIPQVTGRWEELLDDAPDPDANRH